MTSGQTPFHCNLGCVRIINAGFKGVKSQNWKSPIRLVGSKLGDEGHFFVHFSLVTLNNAMLLHQLLVWEWCYPRNENQENTKKKKKYITKKKLQQSTHHLIPRLMQTRKYKC